MIATAVHPKFKFNWIAKENEELTRKVRKLIEAELEKLMFKEKRPIMSNWKTPKISLLEQHQL